MSEVIIPIPARLKNVAVGGHVAGVEDIYDDSLGKTQKEINVEEYNKPVTTGTTGDYPYNGVGRIILKKNMVDGVNTLTQSMMTQSNTVYVIRYDFILGEDINIPENCVLEFDGGSLANAQESSISITGNNTGIRAGLVKIFNTNVTLTGSWNVSEVYPEWFGAKGDGITDDTNAIKAYINFVEFVNLSYIKFNKPYLVSGNITVTKNIDGSILILKECSLILNEQNISITNSTVYFTGEDENLINIDVVKINKSKCSLINVSIEPYNDDGTFDHKRCHSCIKVDSVEGLWGVVIDNCRLWKSVIGIFVYSGVWITSSNFINNKIGCYRNYGILFDDTTSITHCNIENNKFERINIDYSHGKPVAIKLTNWGHIVRGNTLFDDDSNAPLTAQSTFIQYSDSIFDEALTPTGNPATVLNWMKNFSSVFIENNIVEGTFDLGDFRNCFHYNNNLIINHTGNVSGTYDELGDNHRNIFGKNAYTRILDLNNLTMSKSSEAGDVAIRYKDKDLVSISSAGLSPDPVRLQIKIPFTSEFNDFAVRETWAILYVVTNMYQRLASDYAYYYNDYYGSIGTWVNYNHLINAIIVKDINTKIGANPAFQMYYTINPGEQVYINFAAFTFGLNNMFGTTDLKSRELNNIL